LWTRLKLIATILPSFNLIIFSASRASEIRTKHLSLIQSNLSLLRDLDCQILFNRTTYNTPFFNNLVFHFKNDVFEKNIKLNLDSEKMKKTKKII